MPSGGDKLERANQFTPGTFAEASDVNREFDDILAHLNTDAPLGWHRLVDDQENSIDLDFVSASAPTYKVETSSAVNITNIISKGMKIRVEQNTGGTKYGWIITDPTVNTNSKTEFDVYTSKHYTIENETINKPVFSVNDCPHGWPVARLGSSPTNMGIVAKGKKDSTGTSVPRNTRRIWNIETIEYDPTGKMSTANDEFVAPFSGKYLIEVSAYNGSPNDSLYTAIAYIVYEGNFLNKISTGIKGKGGSNNDTYYQIGPMSLAQTIYINKGEAVAPGHQASSADDDQVINNSDFSVTLINID